MDLTARQLLDRIALFLEYPGRAFDARLEAARDLASGVEVEALRGTPAGEALSTAAAELATTLQTHGRLACEERFTTLFDLSPVCTLNIGYHLFGDAYQRGELLAGLVGEMRSRGIDLGDEIPDHLPLLLRLLGRVDDHEDRATLASYVLLPGLAKVTDLLAESQDAWSGLLRVLPDVICALVPDAERSIEVGVGADFPIPGAPPEAQRHA